MRNKRSNSLGVYNPADFDYAPGGVIDPYVALYGTPPSASVANSAPAGTHPLYDAAHNRRLLERESQITAAFDAIAPAMQEVAAMQSQVGFADRAQAMVLSRLGFNLPSESLKSSWLEPLNMRGLYAYSAFQTFLLLAERDFDRSQADHSDGEPADELIRKWGFHAIDISPCADGRLSGVVDYILRVPPTVVANRKSFAGAMFDVEESMRNWVDIELRRYREAVPNPASEPTRYLKIGVYHTSSSDPSHEGCAAHGSDERVAAQQLLDRLMAFSKAIENSHCCGASVATLMIGVDTDTDAIKLHVPNARGEMSLDRYIDNAALFDSTSALEREAAKEAIRLAVAEVAGVAPDDAASEGMRWFCGYLLKNNMAQIEYVRAYHNGRYANLGHTERFITVGDSFEDVQLRNLAYQAQMETVEEGAADIDVGIKIFKKVNMSRGLPVPVFVHLHYDGRVPGSRERAVMRARRLAGAIRARYPDLANGGWLYLYATVKDRVPGSRLEDIDAADPSLGRQCGCGCNNAESKL
ncbi:MAG: carboxysome shell carbonic anhydrase [Gammaproteobacteria bacterium]